MRELSLNILDVAENSLKAGADTIKIDVEFLREENKLTVRVSDNGCGMTGEQIKHVTDPFLYNAHHAQGRPRSSAFQNGGGNERRLV